MYVTYLYHYFRGWEPGSRTVHQVKKDYEDNLSRTEKRKFHDMIDRNYNRLFDKHNVTIFSGYKKPLSRSARVPK